MNRNQSSQPYYVPATPPPSITASSQSMETRPTFAGQADSTRLAIFLAIALASGAALYLLATWPVWACVVAALAAFVAAYLVDTMFATGYLHKAMEQHTERLRIEAALEQNTSGDAAQQEQISQLFDAVLDLQKRMDAMERRIVITDRSGAREVSAADPLDSEIRAWIARDVFGSGSKVVGTHPNGQLRGAMPYKEGSTGYRRLAAAGLVSKQGSNYVWVGPTNVMDALTKLQRQQI